MSMMHLMSPPQVKVNLVQKPTKTQQTKMEATVRDLKRKGFNLYEKAKNETVVLVDNLKELQYSMKSEQDEALKN